MRGDQRSIWPRMNQMLISGCVPADAATTELMFAPRDEGEEPGAGLIWRVWHVPDMTPDRRGTGSGFPAMRYG